MTPPGDPRATLGDLRAAIEEAAAAVADGARPSPTLERPPRPEFGDYSTNVALLLAPVLGEQPRVVADRVRVELESRLGPAVAKMEVAGPGFLNIFLSDRWFAASLAAILATGDRYGGGDAAPGERIDVEFVSANPTGPLHVAHGRHAAYGDALARILFFHGHRVDREFYINDWGSQVRRLGESIQARARGEPVGEEGYQGDYVTDLVDPERAATMDVDALTRAGVTANLERIRATLDRFRVHFDMWFSEASLHEPDPDSGQDALTGALSILEQSGSVYQSEGALWLRSSARGDDKDRVLRRSNGDPTYLASDVAYHQAKLARGYDHLIDVLGADHHGYVARIKAAWEALGGDPDQLELIIMQFVHVLERGERSSMSKRRGEFITLDSLIDEIGVDAARYFLVARSHDTTIDLDLDLAREQNAENPVYYIQYAHARIASMLKRAGEERVAAAVEQAVSAPPTGQGEPRPAELDRHPSERALIKGLAAFPAEVAEASERRAPHRIAAYALQLAQDFTAFYRDCRVLGAEPEPVESWRIALSVATQRTIARALDLLGVTAPASM